MTDPTDFPIASPPRRGLAEASVPFGVPRSMPIGALPVPAFGRAVAELAARGAISGARSQKLSVRVDPLVLAAAPDRFKTWLRGTADTLTDEFQPGL